MKRSVLFFSFIFLFALSGFANENYWQQFVHYQFKVKLDVKDHSLSGEAIITYRNNSPDTLDRVYLHLYPNAFKNENSTMAKESKKFLRPMRINSRNNGYLDILEFRIMRKGTNLPPEQAPIAAYRVDDTILESPLPEKLLPGQEVQLYLRFYEKISAIINRGGWRGKQFDLTQWYPKLVVYDEKGWHPDQYHNQGEFYGEFGTFDVEITLPYNYIVAATGVPVQGDPGWEWVKVDTSLNDEEWQQAYEEQIKQIKLKALEAKERTVVFHAEKVHDFAWLTSPNFLYERGEWNSIPIHVLYDKRARKSWSKKVTRRGESVLKWLSEKFGLYPYPQLTIAHGLLGGGMEYPMIVMDSGPGEGLICHEVGHIYFYGMLANNELDEAWLDEGFTTFQEGWYQQTHYGSAGYPGYSHPKSKLQKWLNPSTPGHERKMMRLVDYTTSGYNEPLSLPAHKYLGGYRMNAYTKGSTFYEMLKYIVGDSVWDRIAHEYFDRWKFKHVNEQRFKQVCEDVSGMDLDWFFDEWMHKTVNVDYKLAGVKKVRVADSLWKTTVKIARKDEGIMPVEVLVVTSKNNEIRQRWDGKAKYGILEFTTKAKPKKVVLDPDDMILDKNRLNNGDFSVKFIPDTPYSQFYRSRNSYLIRYRPHVWYNDVDGLWLGMGFNGSYMNRFKNAKLILSLGLRSRKLGVDFNFSHPLLKNSEKLKWQLRAAAREGRAIGKIGLKFSWSRMRNFPPFHSFDIAFNSAQLLKDGGKYVIEEYRSGGETKKFIAWENGRNNNVSISYIFSQFKPGWSGDALIQFETSEKIPGSEFSYSRLQSQLDYRLGSGGRYLAVRLFGGRFWGDNFPMQKMFFADGANPQQKFEKYYLRSRGSFSELIPYHLPGGGNLRGYLDQRIATDRIAAVNVEASTIRLSPFFRRKFMVNISVFADAGYLRNEKGDRTTLTDAGIGSQWRFRAFYRFFLLRIDFPIYVSDPLPGEQSVRFRWLVSFQQAW
ncbi:MAG: hypothetical protein GXO74_08295 [Calditrichaeota bacterium]|nr:hypothetical protein [Calditrichota bacterium]